MSRGGARPGAGRKKGSVNRATAEQVAAVAASGLTPLNYMLGILRDDKKTAEERFEAAKQAAPYCHAKLAAVDASVDGDLSFTVIINKPADAHAD